MSLQYCRLFTIGIVTLLLAACATTPPSENLTRAESLARWETIQQHATAVSQWELRGKMGVKTGPKGGSATVKWQYQADQQEIELYGPFGGGRVIIKVDADGAVLRDTKGKVIKGATASEVLYERLGWQVPFDHFFNWARGLPGENASDIIIGDDGYLKSLVQDNWQVEYVSYKAVRSGTDSLRLPARLNISAVPGSMEIYSDKGEYLGDELTVKLILRSWSEVSIDPL